MKPSRFPLFLTGIRCILILLFCYTAVSKWLSYDDFLFGLRQSPFLPGGYTALSFLLPATEIGISFLLVWQATETWGFAGAFGLLLLFTAYITAMLLFAPQLPCSCGGFLTGLTWHQHLLLNGAMAVLAAIGFFLSYRNRKLSSTGSKKPRTNEPASRRLRSPGEIILQGHKQ